MQNYNFTPENIDDINGQKSEFFSLVLEQTEDLVNLGLLSNNDFEIKSISPVKLIENISKSDLIKMNLKTINT